MPVNIRAIAAQICFSVVDKGRSLAEEIPQNSSRIAAKDKGLLQEICYGVLRYLPELEYTVQQLMDKPLKGKQRSCHFLLLVGIYQLKYMRIPDHAAVSETVAATSSLKAKHFKNLVNAILRSFQRMQKEQIESEEASNHLPSDAIKYNHPSWFIKKVQLAYPEQWQGVLAANQEKPPMWLRVNQSQNTITDYKKALIDAEIAIAAEDPLSGALKLAQATDVNKLPDFSVGAASVQDAAAQQAARLLDCQRGDKVLDSCAAPGGKTCHILELAPDIESMTALDIDDKRLARVQENLERIGLSAELVAADAADPSTWWQGDQFDRILLDAPCSATGVIRRHPDIKWLRKASDIESLVSLQRDILKKTWSLLKPGGTLLYATCSILPAENSEQIKAFLAKQEDAELIDLPENQGNIGWQILPGEQDMDGFYYAKLRKKLS